MLQPKIVSREEWIEARKRLLAKEKAFTRLIARGEAFYNYELGSVPFEEMSGRSVLFKDPNGEIFHTYSSWGRGGEDILGAYRYFDLTPKGRNENGPYHNMHDWLRHHDRYEDAAAERP